MQWRSPPNHRSSRCRQSGLHRQYLPRRDSGGPPEYRHPASSPHSGRASRSSVPLEHGHHQVCARTIIAQEFCQKKEGQSPSFSESEFQTPRQEPGRNLARTVVPAPPQIQRLIVTPCVYVSFAPAASAGKSVTTLPSILTASMPLRRDCDPAIGVSRDTRDIFRRRGRAFATPCIRGDRGLGS